jgi:DNA-directed RNA polymerase sigma subunit (sigma70/sigma32)
MPADPSNVTRERIRQIESHKLEALPEAQRLRDASWSSGALLGPSPER